MTAILTRRDAIAHLLTRHTRIEVKGHYTGCLCGDVAGRLSHVKHVAALIDELVGGES